MEALKNATPFPSRDTVLRLGMGADGVLRVQRGQAQVEVQAKPCFPWTCATRLVSLLDGDGGEVALVDDLDDLDAASRQALERALAQSGFVFEIERIESIEDEYELRAWSVVTRQGSRRFQTKLDEWPRLVPGGHLLVRDVAGDLYRIAPPATLDPRSRKILWAYADWGGA